MSIYCSRLAQVCSQQCCNIYGNCPTIEDVCYFYYNGSLEFRTTPKVAVESISSAAIAGIALGAVTLVIVLSVVWWRCTRNYQPAEAVASTQGPAVMQIANTMMPTESDQSHVQAVYTFR